MLIRITDHCTMGCSHCMIDASGPDGKHMDRTTFEAALSFAEACGTKVVMLSGGEPTDHPDIETFIQMAYGRGRARGYIALLASNGLFALDDARFRELLALPIPFQVTNDPRYYPRNLGAIKAKLAAAGVAFEDRIRTIFPCRRTREAGLESNRTAPNCFNLRSIARSHGFRAGLAYLEVAMQRVCTPSINVDGSVRAGEADTCYKLGTVDSSPEAIGAALRSMRCPRCGLLEGLNDAHRAAIGEAS